MEKRISDWSKDLDDDGTSEPMSITFGVARQVWVGLGESVASVPDASAILL